MVVELIQLRVTRDFTAAAHTLRGIAPATASTDATWVGWLVGSLGRWLGGQGAKADRGEGQDKGDVDAPE